MIREVFVIKKGTASYYSCADWRPRFSANQEDAEQFPTYEKAKEFLSNSEESWFYEGTYQIEKWLIVEDSL